MSRSSGWQGERSAPPPHPTRLAVTWLGHSTVLLDVAGVRILTDPLLRNRVAHLKRVAPAVPPIGPVDAILLSHAHLDHLDIPSLRRLPRDTPVVVPAGLRRTMRRLGYERVHEVVAGDVVDIGGVGVQATFASHPPGRLLPSGAEPVGYLIQGGTPTYFAGDTDLCDELRELHGHVQVALLPISGWGPRVPEGHLDPDRAAQALELIRPKTCIPIHWGTFRPLYRRRPYEADERAPQRFIDLAASLTPEVAIRVLLPGERWATE